jgi:PDZ domain
VKFRGIKAKVIVNAESGIIQVPTLIENKKYNLALDVGSSISFLSGELFNKLAAAHSDWPHMTGAVGPANMWGSQDEPKWKLMRVDRVQYGPLFLTSVVAVDQPETRPPFFDNGAAGATAGLLGSEALMNYRIGLDYAHSAVYFDIGRTFNFPDFDVIGLILRPEDDGRFTILAIADSEGKASVAEVQAGDQLVAVDGIPVRGSTLGQVLLMLGGEPGKERSLTVERAGKQFIVAAKVQHFLGETDGSDTLKTKSR